MIRSGLGALYGWFFEEGDACAAAMLRIAYGAICLFMLWDLWPVLDLLLGHAGYFGTLDPRFVPPLGLETLLFHADSPGLLRVWFWSFVAVAVAVTAGFCTRPALALSTVFLVLFHRRNPFMLFGADGVLMHVSLWLLFLKAGRVWSVDAWLRARAGWTASRTIPLWPLKALQVQMALIYVCAGVAKLLTHPWRDGSALYYALYSTGNDVFPIVLRQKTALALGTYVAVAIELFFPALVFWRRTRWLALMLVVLLQIGIDTLMAIRFFGPVMYLGLLAFLRPSEWLRVRAWMTRVGYHPRV